MERSKSTRRPACAGLFYPGNEKDLKKLIEACFAAPQGPGSLPARRTPSPERQTLGLVSPHAGFVYSGPVAAHGFFRLASQRKPQRVIILGPNHRGLGASLAVSDAAAWETPFGITPVDHEGVARLAARNPRLEIDETAHAGEHSLEVQLPFLQYIYGVDFAIVPIAMEWLDVETCEGVGKAIAAAFSPEDTLIIASSDFTHYESQEAVNEKDTIALEAVRKLAAAALAAAVERYQITACGVGPIIAMLTACLQWGATDVQVLRHATSGDTSGDYDRVVGYASVAVDLKKA